jgi:transcriptional regulator with XRE-family HTH domain
MQIDLDRWHYGSTFGEVLRAQREASGMKKHDLARVARVSEGLLAEWEAGRGAPDSQQLGRMCKALPRLQPVVRTALGVAVADARASAPPSAPQVLVRVEPHRRPPRAPLSLAPAAALAADAASPAAEEATPAPEIVDDPTSEPASIEEPPPAVRALPSCPEWGRALRAQRVAEGLDQHELGTLTSVAQSTVSRWERGEVWPTGEALDQLHALFPALRAVPAIRLDEARPSAVAPSAPAPEPAPIPAPLVDPAPPPPSALIRPAPRPPPPSIPRPSARPVVLATRPSLPPAPEPALDPEPHPSTVGPPGAQHDPMSLVRFGRVFQRCVGGFQPAMLGKLVELLDAAAAAKFDAVQLAAMARAELDERGGGTS